MYTAKVIGKQNDSGYFRVAVQFSNETDSITEWIDCIFPIDGNWLEKKCANRINELQAKKDAISAVTLKKVDEPPVIASPVVDQSSVDRAAFQQALSTLYSTKRAYEVGMVEKNALDIATSAAKALYKPEYLTLF